MSAGLNVSMWDSFFDVCDARRRPTASSAEPSINPRNSNTTPRICSSKLIPSVRDPRKDKNTVERKRHAETSRMKGKVNVSALVIVRPASAPQGIELLHVVRCQTVQAGPEAEEARQPVSGLNQEDAD